MGENELKKTYLWSYLNTEKEMLRIEDKIMIVRTLKTSPSMINDGMPHGENGGDLSGYAARLDDLERKYKKIIYKRVQLFKEISDKIEAVEDENQRNVLYFRYIKGMGWEDICVKMDYSWQHIHRIHAKALNNFKM